MPMRLPENFPFCQTNGLKIAFFSFYNSKIGTAEIKKEKKITNAKMMNDRQPAQKIHCIANLFQHCFAI